MYQTLTSRGHRAVFLHIFKNQNPNSAYFRPGRVCLPSEAMWGHRGHSQPLSSRILLPPPASTHTAVSTADGQQRGTKEKHRGRETGESSVIFFHIPVLQKCFYAKLPIRWDTAVSKWSTSCCWLSFKIIQDQWFFISQEGWSHRIQDQFERRLHSSFSHFRIVKIWTTPRGLVTRLWEWIDLYYAVVII